MKWMSSPAISITDCGKAFSFTTAFRQSQPVPRLNERLEFRQLHAMGSINEVLFRGTGLPRCVAQVNERRFQNVDVEETNGARPIRKRRLSKHPQPTLA